MKNIQLEETAFYDLIEHLVSQTGKKPHLNITEKWISGEEVMKILKLKSKATLQNFRDIGNIRFVQVSNKIFLYDSESVLELLNKNNLNVLKFETLDNDYTKGFNNGYILAKYEQRLVEKIVQSKNSKNEYFKGLVSGYLAWVDSQNVEKLILVFTGDKNRKELQDLLQLKDSKVLIKNYLQPAIIAGFLEYTNPDQPDSQKRSYRLTEKGVELKQRLGNN